MAKTLTLRLPDDQAAALDLVARTDEQTFTEAVRTAIDEHIEQRRQDAEFRERLARRRKEEAELYKRLAS
jgi:hypothetical protein